MNNTTTNILKILLIIPLLLNSGLLISQTRSMEPSALQVTWEHLTNHYQGGDQLLSEFRISNLSDRPFPSSGWTLYFNYNRSIFPDRVEGPVQISHVNGDIFSLRPMPGFPVLKKKQTQAIRFVSEGEIVTYTSAPSGMYLCMDSDPARGFPIGSFVALPIRDSTSGFITAEDVFRKNAGISLYDASGLCKVMPTPVSYESLPGSFLLGMDVLIGCSQDFRKEAEFLASEIRSVTGFLPGISMDGSGGNILLEKTEMPAEAYTLEITPAQVRIAAGSASGIFYGIQSFRAMLPPEIWKQIPVQAEVPCVRITDSPRFGYRGLHIDVARNFQPKEQIMKVIDVMAFYKLNVLHFHFSDDEGWRIAIPGLPELTDIGSNRGHTLDSRKCLPPSYGAGPDPGKLPASGFYTREEFISLLKYANERHIIVVPEIESPGHSRAAIKSMDARYEKYMAGNQPQMAEEFLLRDPDDHSVYSSAQLWTDNIMCVALPSVYHFIEKVADELAAMYREAGVPLKSIHMGGDEVPEGTWEQSPLCQTLIAADPDLEETADLWYYYFRKTDSLLKKRGLILSGWEEVAMRKTKLDGKRHYIANPDFCNSEFQVHVWNNGIGWGSEDLPYRLANAGYKVILSCVSNNYFDLAYEKSPEEPGYYWGGYQDTDKPYYFIPFDYYRNTKEDAGGNPVAADLFVGKDRLTDYGKTNILGVQGLLWAENVRSKEMQEYLLLPKMIALAERAWAQDPVWVQEKDPEKSDVMYRKSWSEFTNRLGSREFPRLDYMNGGYNYRIPPVGLHVSGETVTANIQSPGLKIRFTADGTLPTMNSTLYSGPVTGKGNYCFAAFDSRGRMGRVSRQEVK